MRKSKKNKVSDLIKMVNSKEFLTLPGNLAYFFVLSTVPVITLILYIATQFHLPIDALTIFIEENFSKDLLDLITPILENTGFNFSVFTYLVIAFFLASNGSNSIIIASNALFNVESDNPLKRRVKAAVLTSIIIILFTFILVVPLFGREILNLLYIIGVKNDFIIFLEAVYPILNIPISVLVIFFFVKLVYTIAPDEKIPSKYVNRGAMFTTISWLVATAIYSFYIKNYAFYGKFYAGLSNIVVLMLWFYLLAYVFVIGIALNYKDMCEFTTKVNSDKLGEIKKQIIENNEKKIRK